MLRIVLSPADLASVRFEADPGPLVDAAQVMREEIADLATPPTGWLRRLAGGDRTARRAAVDGVDFARLGRMGHGLRQLDR